MHRMRERTATAPDGYPVHGWVTTPPGPGPHPVLLTIHGGPFAQYGWVLFDETQTYVSAGYAVVQCNPRGSSGYGAAHGRAIRGAFGDRDAADVLAFLDAALEDPALDGDRVGIMGGSYGGYLTTLLIGRTTRFAAAISERAFNDPVSFVGSSDIGWCFPDQYLGTDPARVAGAERAGSAHAASPRRPWSSTPRRTGAARSSRGRGSTSSSSAAASRPSCCCSRGRGTSCPGPAGRGTGWPGSSTSCAGGPDGSRHPRTGPRRWNSSRHRRRRNPRRSTNRPPNRCRSG